MLSDLYVSVSSLKFCTRNKKKATTSTRVSLGDGRLRLRQYAHAIGRLHRAQRHTARHRFGAVHRGLQGVCVCLKKNMRKKIPTSLSSRSHFFRTAPRWRRPQYRADKRCVFGGREGGAAESSSITIRILGALSVAIVGRCGEQRVRPT